MDRKKEDRSSTAAVCGTARTHYKQCQGYTDSPRKSLAFVRMRYFHCMENISVCFTLPVCPFFSNTFNSPLAWDLLMPGGVVPSHR